MSKLKETTIQDLIPDDANFNKGNEFGESLIEKSFSKFGAGRSILLDKNNKIVAGNKSTQKFVEQGGQKVLVVETDGETLVAVKRTDIDLNTKRGREMALADNASAKANIEWDFEVLPEWFDAKELNDWGVIDFDLTEETETNETEKEEKKVTLADRFLIPPFSVLDARQGYWQERKRAWIALGIQSELGRGENLMELSDSNDDYRYNKKEFFARKNNGKGLARSNGQDLMKGEHVVGQSKTASLEAMRDGVLLIDSYRGKSKNLTWVKGDRNEEELDDTSRKNLAGGRKPQMANDSINSVFGPSEDAGSQTSQTGTSIFDPVLCELVYLWFSNKDFKVLDPFAGGSVRGIVANYLERKYTGVDLRQEQIEANNAQAEKILPANKPAWVCGNSLSNLPDERFDLVFSCPPYYDLEVYSDNEQDLSSYKTYQGFIKDYQLIIKQSVERLNENRFACFVVGDIRDKKGFYRNFVSDTIAAFETAGAKLYNEAILVTSVGSLPIRVGRQFETGRKLGKTHQNVLVFIKGDPKQATKDCGKVDIVDIAEVYGEIA